MQPSTRVPAEAILEWQAFPAWVCIKIDGPLVQKMLKQAYPQVWKFWLTKAALLMQDLEGKTHGPKDGKDLLLLESHRSLHLLQLAKMSRSDNAE